MSHTPSDDHFIQNPEFDLLSHRPQKSLVTLFNAFAATAVFRIWPQLLFFGAWSIGIVAINHFTAAELAVPTTMLTVLGVLLGLTLSYRTSSAYDRYWEGRRLWSQIILSSRSWARLVWIHYSMSATPPEDKKEKVMDETRAILEKSTMVKMALAFSVAVKHYLRGEEGIFYEDLYHLVRFIPSLDLPSGIVNAVDAQNSAGLPSLRSPNQDSFPVDALQSKSYLSNHSGVPLHPARDPPKFRWAETFPTRYFVSARRQARAAGRRAMRRKMKEAREGGGVGQNVPLEIMMFMSSWVATMQRRKSIDVPTITALLLCLTLFSDALASLERILTTPIPWSYNAHVWEVAWIYVLILPFQLYAADFGWITVPATMITAYIVIGFAAIGEEIENPFGYDKNDLNLDFFCSQIIAQEMNAIIARPFAPPESWVFTGGNAILGMVGADELQHKSPEDVRQLLAGTAKGMRMRVRSPTTDV